MTRSFAGRLCVVSLVLGGAVSFTLAYRGVLPIPTIDFIWSGNRVGESGGYRPQDGVTTGKKQEIVLVYIGSSTCGWSNVPELPGVVEEIKRGVYSWAKKEELDFVAIGIARDISVRAGLRHLEKFGLFDEVVAGRSWANGGFQEYVYGEMSGPGVTPQVVVVLRRMDYKNTGQVVTEWRRVLVRLVGLGEIIEWQRGSDLEGVMREMKMWGSDSYRLPQPGPEGRGVRHADPSEDPAHGRER